MDTEIMVETLPLLGVCNLCLNEGPVKSMLIEHNYNGNTEFYVEMLLKCFSIDISSLDLGDTKRLVCDACIEKLRDSVLFREQVETSLETLETASKLQKMVHTDSLPEVVGIQDEGSLSNDAFTDLLVEAEEKPVSLDPEKISEEVKNEPSVADYITGNIDSTYRQTDRKKQSRLSKVLKRDRVLTLDLKEVDSCGVSLPDSEVAIKTELTVETEQCFTRKTRRKLTSKNLLKCSKKKISLHKTETMLAQGLFPFKILKNQAFSCAICPEESTNLDDIKTHILEHNTANIHVALKKMIFSNSQRFYMCNFVMRCKICTSDIKNYEELKAHLENCTRLKCNKNWNSLPFKLEKDQLDCPVCKKVFLNYVNLNTHMNQHFPNHICENCGKAFASRARLRGHMRTHEIGHFPCRYCPAVFDVVTKRENHVSKEHKSGVRYACKRCNITLTSFYARQKHLAEVHNEELKKYKCKACSQSYITPGHLSSHVRRDHLNERNHECSQCDLAFYTRNALKMHMIKHDGERIHTCNICQKSYQRKKTLREHMRIHDNDKRFVCPVCGRAFTQKCTLKGHLKVHDK